MRNYRDTSPAQLFFQKVSFGEENLPSYIDREAYLSWIKPLVRRTKEKEEEEEEEGGVGSE